MYLCVFICAFGFYFLRDVSWFVCLAPTLVLFLHFFYQEQRQKALNSICLCEYLCVCHSASVTGNSWKKKGGEGAAKDEGPRGGTRPCQWRRPVVLFKELLNMVKACAWVCECCLCMYVLNKYFGSSFLDYILEQLQMGSTYKAGI